MEIKIQPITNWVGKQTKEPRSSQFRQTYSDTKKILFKELEKLNVVENSLILSMFIHPNMVRQDGNLRADAKPFRQGVILSFSRHKYLGVKDGQRRWKLQPLRYPCDAFNDWQDNLRAIALSLEALRKVERYGVFSYEEIVDRLSLPSADDKVSSAESAAEFIATHADFLVREVLMNKQMMTQAYRKAAQKLHPDNLQSGDQVKFVELQKAKEILDKHFN